MLRAPFGTTAGAGAKFGLELLMENGDISGFVIAASSAEDTTARADGDGDGGGSGDGDGDARPEEGGLKGVSI
jgi:hypothetical protein